MTKRRVTCISCGQKQMPWKRGCCEPCYTRRMSASGAKGFPTPCDHCVVGRGWSKRRRLCDECHADETIACLYGGKDVLMETDRVKCFQQPETPTIAQPGSAEKILVMAQRFAQAQELHHPADARLDHAPSQLGFTFGGLRIL